MKRIAFGAIALALLVAFVGYAAADAMDKVPGVLTIAPTPPAMSSPMPSAPVAASPSDPPLPTSEGLTAALGAALADPALGSSVAMTVLDADTGEELFSQATDSPRTVASLQKLISAMVVSSTVPLDTTLRTRLVDGGDGRLVLQAGGDLYLNPGAGDPSATIGRAGLADLADKAAVVLGAQTGPWVLSIDTRYADGPEILDTWDSIDVAYGYTGRVSNLGLSTDRADEGKPSPANPAKRTADALAALLNERGITTTVAPADTLRADYKQVRSLAEIESAPVEDLLAVALQDSDNALMEELARVAYADAADVEDTSIGLFLTRVAASRGIAASDLQIVDASGLSGGQTVTVRALAQTLRLATDGTHQKWRQVVLRLPIAGLSGTLAERFDDPDTQQWAGIPREKTGTLTGTSAVGGWTVDADGRSLLYVVVADEVSSSFVQGTVPARASLDRLVGVLTSCGCQ